MANGCAWAKADAVTGRQIPNLLLRGTAHSDTSTAIVTGEGKGGQLLAEEISLVNPAPAGGSSQCRLSAPAHVLQPHHAAASGDQ